ncbi:hypothetical protein DL98DRAFT_600276 [Cadophora sp. DSE1049]|nr:hypothetical protein DL98DRAFT_600276 [Cadophora sp. DSE1049]
MILQVLLLETVVTYVILSLAYLYLAATQYKKEGQMLLLDNVLSCTLISVAHGIGVYLAGNPQELTLSVWAVSALAILLVTLQFRFCLLCRGRPAEVDLKKQHLDDPGVPAVKSLVMMTLNIPSLVPSTASSLGPLVLSDLLHTSMPTVELSQLQRSLQGLAPEKTITRQEQPIGASYNQVLSKNMNADGSLRKSNNQKFWTGAEECSIMENSTEPSQKLSLKGPSKWLRNWPRVRSCPGVYLLRP